MLCYDWNLQLIKFEKPFTENIRILDTGSNRAIKEHAKKLAR
jgi:hypothetical protein